MSGELADDVYDLSDLLHYADFKCSDSAMHFIVAKPAPDINRGAKCRVAPTQSCVIHNCLHDFNQLPLLNPKTGGGGRTRTDEGLASGFTVRPLCRSGHSPASDEAFVCPRERKRLGRAEAMGLMLPCRAACQPKNPGLSQRAGRRAEAGLAWRQGLGLERTITASKGLPQ